jgi:phage-related holin
MLSHVRRMFSTAPHEIAGLVYGTIVTMGALAAGSHAETDPWRLAAAVSATVLVLWIAHVYSDALAETIATGHRLDRDEFMDVARHEVSIPLAAVAPVIALVLGGVGVFRETTSVWVAFGIGIATLVVEGVRYAGVEHLSRLAKVLTVAVNVSLGLVIVALKVVLSH